MILPPHLQQVLDEEHALRGLNWLGVTGSLCGSPVVALTPRHYAELRLAGNALLSERAPMLADVFDLLWRLHPNFARPDGSLPNRPPPSPGGPSRFSRWLMPRLARAWLIRHVRTIDLFAAEVEIRNRLSEWQQDCPPREQTSKSEDESLPPPAPYFLDSLCDWYGARYGCQPHVALDVPLALIYQLRRRIALSQGEAVIDRSRAQLLAWFCAEVPRRQREKIAAQAAERAAAHRN